jgi:hypothetical protein
VKLKITAHDSKSGKKIENVVCGITVTDESVLESIEKRKQSPRLLSMVYLENEVQNLEDANVYLNNYDGDDNENENKEKKECGERLDLLLGNFIKKL